MLIRFNTAMPVRAERKPVILAQTLPRKEAEAVSFSGSKRTLPALALAAAFLPILGGCSNPAQEKMEKLDRFQPAVQQLPVLKEVITGQEAWSYTRVDALTQLSSLNLPAAEKVPVFLKALEHDKSMSDGELEQAVAAKHGLLVVARESKSEALTNQIFKVLALYPEVYYGSKHSVHTEDFSPEYREASAKLLEMLKPQAEAPVK